ncbi:hypothetical protein K8089_06035 [Aequorivita sp. F47161]|jgi:hypothetical protein|uniref:YD repeat-containing protein n=1 Tax=Aequorivita vitellina TaxID=2874475 RepID=A0A9X1QUH1_9FLAO|nr:hypothetical protein [Aequorivita vitellina]MCG2418575.1 hypothetical protein [Aequorivita vitellina]
MKRILLLFAASLLTFACSSNDDVPAEPQELKIKKFSQDFYFNQSTDNYTLERLFDESGQTVSESTIHPQMTFNWLYSYNSSGLISEKSLFYDVNAHQRQDIFAYDVNNEIDGITFENGLGDVLSIRDYTIENDKITYEQASIYGEIYYNAEGKIVKNFVNTDTGTSTQIIEYTGDNISQINETQSNGFEGTYTFEYDDGVNPLYDCVENNYTNATIGDHISLFKRHNYFSKNNYTQITFISSIPDSNYVKTKTTIYNADGYPTNAVVEKNGVLIEELTYDYY